MRFFAFLCLLLPLFAGAADLSKAQRAAIEERIKPFSEVCVAGDSSCGAGGEVQAAAVEALPGEAKYATCSACHGAEGQGGVGPMLAGQTVDYIVGRLNAYKAGETVGAQSSLMWGQAAGLTDTDIQDLAEYVETL